MIDNILLYAKNLRESGAYWLSALSELIAMIKFLGTPHFFITLSCNDLYRKDMLTALLIADGRPDTDFNKLIEFQNRSLPYFHIVVWVSGIPVFDSEEGIELIDKIVKCSIPKDDEEMKSWS
uniref:PH domain-containing protein n=1 Tax=Strongyloides venezuelensis TaxID=75913 RepID=A0A0K0FEG2_STRVS